MRLIDADAAKDALKEIEDVFKKAGLYPWNIIDQVPTVCDIYAIKADIYEQFMSLNGEMHDVSARKCLQIIDKHMEGDANGI